MTESTGAGDTGAAAPDAGTGDGRRLSDLAQLFTRITFRPTAQICEFYLLNGKQLTFPARFDGGESTIEALSYLFTSHSVEVETKGGSIIEVELEMPGDTDVLKGRPVVYLDQCHWSAIANRLYGGPVAGAAIAATDKVIQLAREKRIILPMSAGHFLETVATYGVKRANLASAILTLSSGWRMRHPIQVRQDEARNSVYALYAPAEHVSPPVFTLDASVMFNELPAVRDFSGLPAEVACLSDRLTSIAADYDTLMDTERIGSDRTTTWEDTYRNVMNDPEFRALSPLKRRKASHGLALMDILQEVARICFDLSIPPGRLEDVTQHLFASFPEMPFWGLYADALAFRLSQGNTKWQSNDLIDMLYLSCAAGYADVVVAERSATNYLNAVWGDRSGQCPVVKDLISAADRL